MTRTRHPVRFLPSLVLALLLWISAASVAHAQAAVIDGTVTDATGLVLPGVTVEARSAAPDGPFALAVSDGAGTFAITGLPPGSYDVTFALAGFHTEVRRGVAVGAGATVTLDAVLSVQLEEQVVVVGSRAQPRSVTESPVPIDAIPFRDVMSQGASSLDFRLRTLVPSFNVATHPISGAASLVRPVSLRNLAHDHTLVLVDGKRRHRSAILVWFGGVTDGTQGPDISSIPSIALRQVEVLRDGASAQYGSDAIAGVLNFLPKDAREGGSLELTTGTYRAGDGDAYNVAGNVGLPLGNTGFANLSFEYGNADPTNRSVQRADAAALIAAGNTAVADPAQIWGDPTIEDDLKLFGNFGHAYANGLELYGHANYAGRTATQGFYYRNPNTRANIFSLDSGRTLLVGDALDARDGVRDGSAGCPTVRITDNRPDQGALAQVSRRPELLLLPGDRPRRVHPEVQWGDHRSVGGRRRAPDVGQRPDLGRQRRIRLPRGGLLPLQLRQRLARSGDPSRLRSRSLPAGGGQPQLRCLLRRHRDDPPGRRHGMAGRALHDPLRRAVVLGGRPVRVPGLRLRIQRLRRVSRLHRRHLGPRQRRRLRRRRAATAGRPMDRRRRPAGRALRRLRRHGQRKAVGPLRAGRHRLAARWRQHRVPRADPRPAEHVQRAVDHQSPRRSIWSTAPPCRRRSGPPSSGAAGRSIPRRRPTRRPGWWSTPDRSR